MSSSILDPFKSRFAHITKNHGASPATKPQPKPPDKTLAKGDQGGGGGRKAKPIADERESEEDKADREQANTPPPDKPVDRLVVKITHLDWETETLAIGAVAWVTMDVAIPPEHAGITKITCSVEDQSKGGPWKPGTKSAECHAEKGKAKCEIELPVPPKGADEKPPAPGKSGGPTATSAASSFPKTTKRYPPANITRTANPVSSSKASSESNTSPGPSRNTSTANPGPPAASPPAKSPPATASGVSSPMAAIPRIRPLSAKSTRTVCWPMWTRSPPKKSNSGPSPNRP